ncbi:MAG: amino acid adenylation domain-containing protein [Symploca sp. SIO2B6]|nr:amino acid adenylation domain-containing protein [Symploca sp. SIO2B6]
MNLNQLIAELSEDGVQLWTEQNQLRIRAPKGVLTPELRNSLTECKEELIKLLNQSNSKVTQPSSGTIQPNPDQRYEPFPLTDLQQGYWVGRSGLLELSIGTRYYLEIESNDFELKRLSSVWQQLIQRHDMLRSVVLSTGEQQILKKVDFEGIKVLDFRGLKSDIVATELEKVRQQMSRDTQHNEQETLFQIQASLLDENTVRLHLSFDLLIIDGRSLQILIQEMAELLKNPHAVLLPLELSFRDYVLARQTLQDSEDYKQALEYWHNRIPKLPPGPELPLAKQSSSLTDYHFTHLGTKLAPDTWLKIKNKAATAGITPTIILFAAYAEVLTAWSKNPKFTLIFLYSNRLSMLDQVDSIVGNFNSTILIEVDNSSLDNFEVRAKRLQQQFWNVHKHNLITGVQVIREINRLQGERQRATIPVTFGCEIPYTNAFNPKPSSKLNEFVQVYNCLQVPQVFLDHQISLDANGCLSVNWDFVSELFPKDLIETMFDVYIDFLHRLAWEKDILSGKSLNLLPSAQLQKLALVNATDVPLQEQLLHTLFIKRALATPEHLALVSSQRILTYQELCQRSNYLAIQLRRLGVSPNQLVAIVMEKGWEQIVGVLAILIAGGAYVPIEPNQPQERCTQLLEQSEVKLVLTQSWLDETLFYPEGIQLISVDLVEQDNFQTSYLNPIQQWGDLAYVIYTSGSTGIPKGVMIDHRGAVNTIVDLNQRLGINSQDKVLAISALNFDLSVYDIFGTLAAGGTIVLPDASGTKEPAHWLDLIQREKITVWNSVPALMQLLVEYANSQEIQPSSLRLVMLSGDWLPLSLPPQIKTLIDTVQVISLGGATEASIWSILYPIETVEPGWKSIPYGMPMMNQKFFVFDHKLELCPVWAVGHLYIGGIGLAKGYWKNEEKTRSNFIIHPRTGERLYRTGDLGRYLPDGNIEFLGREDFQVKVQGYRIECGEIETLLLKHPSLKAAVVTAVGEQQAAKRLVAYVVLNDEFKVKPSELQDFLANKLPQYMIPSIITILSEMPLTANGKIDRRSLPVPDLSNSASAATLILPRNLLEIELAQIWSKILDVYPVGIQDDFFDLGGYSFAAMRLMAQIQHQFGKTLPLVTLLENPTIEHLASLLRSSPHPPTYSPLVAIKPLGNQPPFFCIHPVGGNVLCYVDLARYLGKEQPFYGLQAAGLQGERQPLTRIEDMASFYIQAIQKTQPEGPYYLGGWSLGGIIAFEMAQQLSALGQEVALLALIDSYLPTVSNQSQEFDDAMLVASVAQDLSGIVGKPLSISIDELRRFQPPEQLEYILEQAKRLNILPPEVDALQFYQILQVFKANNQAMYSYIPQIYPGRITLFCASEQVKVTQVNDWEKLAVRGIKVHRIPGNHYSIIREPQVRFLTEHLQAYFSNWTLDTKEVAYE